MSSPAEFARPAAQPEEAVMLTFYQLDKLGMPSDGREWLPPRPSSPVVAAAELPRVLSPVDAGLA
jgi:hypothetical protein